MVGTAEDSMMRVTLDDPMKTGTVGDLMMRVALDDLMKERQYLERKFF